MSGRDQCLKLIVEQLGGTRPGRDLGLHRLHSLSDFRATLPIRSQASHSEEVEAVFAFGTADDPGTAMLAALERENPVGIWGRHLGPSPPARVAMLRGRHFDTAVDEILVDDLEGIGGELRRIDRWEDAASALEHLEEIDPEVLVLASSMTCAQLEAVHRSPLDRRLPGLRLILSEHDLRAALRTRVPVRSAGWIHAGGRLGVPSGRGPDNAVTLAVGSSIIELLPYTNPEEDGRRVYAFNTVLPERAVVGARYELVFSSPQGFIRLRTGEHVRVVGFDMPSQAAPFPRPRVVRLSPAPADLKLEGCTVAGAWLTASVRGALHREDPALVFAEVGLDPLSIPSGAAAMRTGSAKLPEAFKDTELGWLTKTGMHRVERKHPRGLLVRIEVQGFVGTGLVAKLSARVDGNLRLRSPAYAHLREREELHRPRVLVVPAGTRSKDEARRVARLGGEVQLPDVRVVEPG